MNSQDRKIARALAQQYINENKPTQWFEELYRRADFNLEMIPWADREVNPNLSEWIDCKPADFFKDKKVLKVGCGLGDDSEYWTKYSGDVEAFDISPTAIEWCRKRFPGSKVHYFEGDLLALNESLFECYDVVQESYTLQVLPPELRALAILQLPRLLKKGGILLVICRGRDPGEFEGDMPFPLTKEELSPLSAALKVSNFEDYLDHEDPPVRRFRIEYGRP